MAHDFPSRKSNVLLYLSGAKDTVTTSGINIGSYSQGGNAYVCFTGKVLESTFEEVVDKAIVTVNEEATIDSVTMRLD